MTIYDEIQQQLEDSTISVSEIAAIGFSGNSGWYVLMDDESRRSVSEHDYRILDDRLEELHEAYLKQYANQ